MGAVCRKTCCWGGRAESSGKFSGDELRQNLWKFSWLSAGVPFPPRGGRTNKFWMYCSVLPLSPAACGKGWGDFGVFPLGRATLG